MRQLIEETSSLPEPVKAFFQQHVEESLRVLSILNQLDIRDALKSSSCVVKDSATAYENDGNTQCPGSSYDQYLVVPVGREIIHSLHEEVAAYRNGSQDCCIVFACEIKLRDSDEKITWKSSEVHLAPFVLDFNVRNTQERIANSTAGLVKLNTRGILRLHLAVDEIKRLQKLERTIESFDL